MSTTTTGGAGNGASSGVALNMDGAFITFYSDASNLVVDDTNDVRDVFVHHRGDPATERASVSSPGEQANRASHEQGRAPAINGDGTVVAFYSAAFNLVPDDTNGKSDVFVRVSGSAATERVSVAWNGAQGDGSSTLPSISRNGQLVAFPSLAANLVPNDTNDAADIFIRDRVERTTERLCRVQGNGSSTTPAISADGTVVAFASAATNLVSDDRNGHLDIFVCDRHSGTPELVSVSSAGVPSNGDSLLPAISEDGRFVAFKSAADKLADGDTNDVVDVFVRDRVLRTTERVSVNLHGGNADDASFPPSISFDGRFVAFGSAATNLVDNDFNHVPSVFLRDRLAKRTVMVDVASDGQQANAGTPDVAPSLSGDGQFVGFVSFASNLAPAGGNQVLNVFLTTNPFACTRTIQCVPGSTCLQGFCTPPAGHAFTAGRTAGPP